MEQNYIEMREIGEDSNTNLDAAEDINSNTKFNKRKKKYFNNKIVLIVIVCLLILVGFIFISKFIYLKKEPLIDNNIEKNIGVVQLINEETSNKTTIKKDLLKNINNFIACIGTPGSGKSTFGSNYYKYLYDVKNDYFESSDSELTFTKGIWMISDEERRKIPEYIDKDILDVEGFEIDESKSWKIVMIIAFLSSDLIILNRNPRLDVVRKVVKIIENYLKKMMELNIPRILKKIYIQVNEKPKKTIEELLESFKYDKNTFQTITFKYFYLPNIQGKNKDIMDYSDYRTNFKQIIDILLNETNNYNSVSSLMNYVDLFNIAINGNGMFKSQNIFKDIKDEFEGIYNKIEIKIKNELIQKIPYLKKLELNETFEDFINKQTILKFEFDIKNENFTFYGSSKDYNDYYEKLKKNKTFKIEPKNVFLDFYETEKLKLEIKESKKKEVLNIFLQKRNEIISYFSSLQFYESIVNMDLKINVDIEPEFKIERENNLKQLFNNKKEEKEKEWEDQIKRAKWKKPVQSTGETKCKNGHTLADEVVCSLCHEKVYWVDSDAGYVICRGCEIVRKISEPLRCMGCGAEILCRVKRISGYKP